MVALFSLSPMQTRPERPTPQAIRDTGSPSPLPHTLTTTPLLPPIPSPTPTSPHTTFSSTTRPGEEVKKGEERGVVWKVRW